MGHYISRGRAIQDSGLRECDPLGLARGYVLARLLRREVKDGRYGQIELVTAKQPG